MIGGSSRFYYLGLMSRLSSPETPKHEEVVSSNYRRRPIVFGKRDASGRRVNVNLVEFDPAEEDGWGEVEGFGLFRTFRGDGLLDTFPIKGDVTAVNVRIRVDRHDRITVAAGEIKVLDLGADADCWEEPVVEVEGDVFRLSSAIPRVGWRTASETLWMRGAASLCGIVLGRRSILGRERVVVLGDDGAIYAAEAGQTSSVGIEMSTLLRGEFGGT